MSAPSGMGSCHVVVVRDSDIRQQLRIRCEAGEKRWFESQPISVRERLKSQPGYTQSTEFMETAPLLLVVTTRPMDPELPYAVECAFLSVGYMLVMIEGLGLGTNNVYSESG